MSNEILLISSLIVIYGSVLLAHKLLGKTGLYAFTVFATILANIEVLILVDAFGLKMTLGNILFASTFLVTDILSENYGKKAANKAVTIGIGTSILFILVSQSWLLYSPSPEDWVSPSISTIFATTPRLLMSSLSVFAIAQFLDVNLYHLLWKFTIKKFGKHESMLYIRNNMSTLVSQFVNAILFNVFAFGGVYDITTLMRIILSTYIISICTSLADTPVVYLSRKSIVK